MSGAAVQKIIVSGAWEAVDVAAKAGALFPVDAVMSLINGQRDAQRLIHAVRQGCAPADALLEGFDQVRANGDADRLRGFARELQKTIERSAGRPVDESGRA